MKPLDERLLDPTQDALVALLVRATSRANSRLRWRRLDKGGREWERVVRRHSKSAEGHLHYQGGHGGVPAACVELSWWTDAVGRKHWRVTGRRLDLADQFGPEPPAAFARHPLWHVYPSRLLIRRSPSGDELLAACSCGAAGTPASIAWTGERCGPCHDRILEGLPSLPIDLPAAAKLHDASIGQMAFAGRDRLVTSGRDGVVMLWEFESDERRALMRRREGADRTVAVSAGGRIAVTSGNGRVSLGLIDSGPWRSVNAPAGFVHAMRFSPDGRRLVVAGSAALLLLDAEGEAGVVARLPPRSIAGLTWLPDGGALALFENRRGVLLLDLETEREVVLREEETPADEGDSFDYFLFDGISMARVLEVSPDGRWLAIEGAWEGTLGVHLCDLTSGVWRPLSPGEKTTGVITLRFASDGKLAVCEADGSSLWDPTTRVRLGTLLTAPGGTGWAGARAFSPDGELLAAAELVGEVAVWPWRRLMG